MTPIARADSHGTATVNPAQFAQLGEALFEEARDAMFLLDPGKNRLLEANTAAARLTGFSRAEIQGMAFAHLVDYPQPEQWQSLQHAIRQTTSFHAREGYRLRTATDGKWVPVDLTISRLHVKPA